MSPYNYAAGNPVNAVDRDGDDVLLLIWASQDGNVGHSAVAISNYITEERKVKENGKWITHQVQVPDGTYSVHDLWPASEINKSNYWESVSANFKNSDGHKYSYNDLLNKDVTRLEDRPADGIIKFNTSSLKDQIVIDQLSSFEKSKNYYNAIYNNCSDYVKRALTTVIGKPEINTYEKAEGYKITTPNQMYKAAIKAPGAIILKDAGDKIQKGSLESATRDNVEKTINKIPFKDAIK